MIVGPATNCERSLWETDRGRWAGFNLHAPAPEVDWLFLADADGLTDARLGVLADALNAALRECGLQGPVHIVDRRDATEGAG
ncbi:hypothetical protein [Actinomyces sp.]|uniref:hypothetical protein n=1 Tax=Actinomyces sp. TaxID=29317 RepID=UPI0026DCDCB4|nr:hypothetical protein [Actinomyces sp.]MDO4899612.1 hypothetical protein [Actinomyces sp.]